MKNIELLEKGRQYELGQNIQFSINHKVVLILDEFGMIYKGNRVEDAGEAYELFMQVLSEMKEFNKIQ